MKNKIGMTLILVSIILLIPCIVLCETTDTSLSADICQIEGKTAKDNCSEQTIKQMSLPSGLMQIEDEAFEGTAFTNVTIPESVREIGDRAFADIEQLLLANISANVIKISENAFEGVDNLILRGLAGGDAQKWAKGRNIPFALLEQIRKMNETANVTYVPDHKDNKKQQYLTNSTIYNDTDQINHRQGTYRTIGELKASCYTGTASVYVRSRYFP